MASKKNGKFEWTTAKELKPIKVEDLVCKDCFHRGGRTDVCAAYHTIKPNSVLDGGDCNYYKKENTND